MAKAPVKAKPVVKKVAVKKPAVKKVNKPATKTSAKPATKKAKATKPTGNPAKDLANERGEPYVAVLSVDIDPNDVQNGAFELDWNDKFIADLVRHGYMMDPKDTDADIVDRWFTAVCRNVVLETYEQYEAMNPQRVIKSRDIGDGRSEIS